MKRLLATIHYFTRTERIGILYLCSIAVVILLLPRLLPWLYPPTTYDFSAFQEQVALLQAPEPTANATPTLFPFNPNKISQTEWQQLGISKKLARTIVNYRNKGGRFYRKEDLQKIYGLSTETYEQLAPFIQLETSVTSKPLSTTSVPATPALFSFDPNTVSGDELTRLGVPAKVATTWINFRKKGGTFSQAEEVQKVYGLKEDLYQTLFPYINIAPTPKADTFTHQANLVPPPADIPIAFEQRPVIVDINQSQASDWEQLKGIGPAYARRILNFRERLGGFVSIEQVAQTYHLPDSTYRAIQAFLRTSPISRPLKINQATAKELQSHPYINWKQANAIVNYRDQHGKFSQVDDLLLLHALPDEVINKITPYLSFE